PLHQFRAASRGRKRELARSALDNMKTIKAASKRGDIDEAAGKWDKLRRSPKFVTTQNYMYIWMLNTHQQLETADDGAAERLLQKWLPHNWDAGESKQIEQPHAGECASENKWIGVKIDTDRQGYNEIEQSSAPECDSERWIDVTRCLRIQPNRSRPKILRPSRRAILPRAPAIARAQANYCPRLHASVGMAQAKQLLDYVASQEEAVLTFSASEMKLTVHSDAGYLNEPNARSRAGGHFFLSNDADVPTNNGAILNISHVIKHVMSSATEAELAGLYIMAREAVYIRIILEEMGHKQSPTPVQTDNAIAEKVINKKVQPKRTKAMDMRFHWLRDRECQRQFRFYWRPGKLNYADYWTKHHPATHHNNVRRNYLTPLVALEMFRQEERRRKQDAKQPT
ncbi:hypothetical protein THAOC_29472, partial [Thalassiosira oceanica]